MFQTFTSAANPAAIPQRVKKLTALLAKSKLEAFLVPRSDEHQGEYVAPCAERLKWLTGFSGSAGVAVVGRKKAALFVDGRYTAQARRETDPGLFDLPGVARAKMAGWLIDKLPKGTVIGFDPWLHTAGDIARLQAQLKPKGLKLKPVGRNLVDRIWAKERPSPPEAPIVPHPIELAGRSAADKIADIQTALRDERQDAVVLTLPDSIAWLFNIRGSDVAHHPVVLAFAIVPANGKPELFVADAKVTKDARAHLEPVAKISGAGKLEDRIRAHAKAGRKVRIDPETSAWWFTRKLGPKSLVRAADPCLGPKAIKNAAEIAGARAAHLRDGAALVRYLAWFDAKAETGSLDEITAVKRLEEQRARTLALKEISFDTISGSGPNGAIVHYRVTEPTNRKLELGELFLLDSGAQYADGTTDITRTIAVGKPSLEMCERFSLVLKGHIAIATARFPKGTRGMDLDPFARRALWAAGLDYDHGTGHGVGSYLSVHEGPQSISRAGMAILEPGMICSNEPGYYKEGQYGIRIENLVLISEAQVPEGGDRPMMGFETLTLVPIDRRLVIKDMLEPAEIAWLDAYHARVRKAVEPDVDAAAREWLITATAPL